MTAHPMPSAFESRTNATYEALIWALARPGLPRTMPDTGPAGIIEALIDRECAVHCADPDLTGLAARTGASIVGPEDADHVFASTLPRADVLHRLRRGSDLHPDDGATLVCAARLGSGPRLRLSGPGCDGPVALSVDGLPPGFWEERARLTRYPMGFELVLVDGRRIVGIPRSTTVEVI